VTPPGCCQIRAGFGPVRFARILSANLQRGLFSQEGSACWTLGLGYAFRPRAASYLRVEEAPTIGLEQEPAREARSFEAFFQDEHARLFGTLCLLTGDSGEAEDVMQEAFLKLWERWERAAGLQDPVAYLYRTAFNSFRSRRRRLLRSVRRPAMTRHSEDPLPAVELRHAVVGALRKLAPRQRAAVVLTEIFDLSSAEAAQALGVRPGTVRMLASQGRAAMRRILEVEDA
jgi:RNA polymerase sigma-70 factor (ECF subfamily)